MVKEERGKSHLEKFLLKIFILLILENKPEFLLYLKSINESLFLVKRCPTEQAS